MAGITIDVEGTGPPLEQPAAFGDAVETFLERSFASVTVVLP